MFDYYRTSARQCRGAGNRTLSARTRIVRTAGILLPETKNVSIRPDYIAYINPSLRFCPSRTQQRQTRTPTTKKTKPFPVFIFMMPHRRRPRESKFSAENYARHKNQYWKGRHTTQYFFFVIWSRFTSTLSRCFSASCEVCNNSASSRLPNRFISSSR